MEAALIYGGSAIIIASLVCFTVYRMVMKTKAYPAELKKLQDQSAKWTDIYNKLDREAFKEFEKKVDELVAKTTGVALSQGFKAKR